MKKFVALPTKEKRHRMNEKMITPTFFELYTVYLKKLGNSFPMLYSPYIFLLEGKYFEKLISEV